MPTDTLIPSSLDSIKSTPMMEQWKTCKQQAQEALLLFRMGDFYEAFYEDAVVIAKELELTLTKRQEIPMSGIPYHTCDLYLDRLVAKGYHVAIAEQTENPKLAKGLVKRELVRIVTPGTLIQSSLLKEKTPNFFASITQVSKTYGLGIIELSTGDFRALECDSIEELTNELYRYEPSELLICDKTYKLHLSLFQEIKQRLQCVISLQPSHLFEHHRAYTILKEHFKVQHLEGFGLKGMVCAINACGGLIDYLQTHLRMNLSHIQSLLPYQNRDYLMIDHASLKHLELISSQNKGGHNTLLHVLDETATPMGGRLLRYWVCFPLLSLEAIIKRQTTISWFLTHSDILSQLRQHLFHIKDLERLITKIATNYASPKDLVALRHSLEQIPPIHNLLKDSPLPHIQELIKNSEGLSSLAEDIKTTISDDPPLRLNEGCVIKKGIHQELDELKSLREDSETWLQEYQQRLRNETQIKTLKVGYSSSFGYYIDVSKGQADKMPTSFLRRQTLVNNERFISPELKTFEEKILTAQDSILAIEQELFHAFRQHVTAYQDRILKFSQSLAQVDCLSNFALIAQKRSYICPTMHEGYSFNIEQGRHPVVENVCLGETFIPNDTYLDEQQKLGIITGPNMAGKSTYIRQVALISIMAQIGSFVPAKSAHLSIVDKIFTRIGASDDLSRGHSTFMVEMSETANILHHATSRSLVILDEIGRGTSTYDGISIAWSVAEYLLHQKKVKTLFATHYFELTKMPEQFPDAKNFHIAVQETKDTIIFLRKILPGDTDRSYGIHVAQLAGLPKEVTERAKEILKDLEKNETKHEKIKKIPKKKLLSSQEDPQFYLFPLHKEPEKEHEIFKEMRQLNPDHLSPMQALQMICRWKEQLTHSPSDITK